jgi:hypothetical protein
MVRLEVMKFVRLRLRLGLGVWLEIRQFRVAAIVLGGGIGVGGRVEAHRLTLRGRNGHRIGRHS